MKFKNLILCVFLLLIAATIPIRAQQTVANDTPIRYVSALPATCNPTSKNQAIIYKYTVPRGIYYCSSANTWALITSGGGISATWGSISGVLTGQADLNSALNGKQPTLVSGTNLKTVNGSSLLGSGNVTVSSATLSNTYGNSLSTAISSIGSTLTTLVIDSNTTCSSGTYTVPATLVLEFKNGAKIIKSAGCTINFQGTGILHPLSQIPYFSGFSPGDIAFTGTVRPASVAVTLWEATALDAQVANADAAFSGVPVTLEAYPGLPWTTVRTLTQYHKIHFNKGTYTNTTFGAFSGGGLGILLLGNDTEVYGDGPATVLQESINNDSPFFSALAMNTYPFDGAASNLSVHDIKFVSNAGTANNAVQSAIMLGNVVNGQIRRCVFDHLHAFGAYVGSFSNSGNKANQVWITDNTFIGLSSQNTGTVGGDNIHITNNTFVIETLPTAQNSSVIDIEPNADTIGSENIDISNNIFDGRLAQQYYNAIQIQKAYGGATRHVRVSGNTIRGGSEAAQPIAATEVNTSTDTITVYNHGLSKGEFVIVLGTIPGGLGASPFFGNVIYVDKDHFKLATSYNNAIAGSAIDLTTTGGDATVMSAGFMSNGIYLTNVEDAVVEDNTITGGQQAGLIVDGCYRCTVQNNTLLSTNMVVSNSIQGTFAKNNLSQDPNLPVSQGDSIGEISTGTATVSTTAGSKLVTVTSDQPLVWYIAGLPIRINGVDYIIDKRVADKTIKLTTNAVSNLSGVVATLTMASNRYIDNAASSTTLAAGGSSKLMTFTGGRAVATSFAPPQITSTQNDYQPSIVARRYDLTTDIARNITGLTWAAFPAYQTPQDGQKVTLHNAGLSSIVLKHQDSGSTAAYRLKSSTGSDITLAAGELADLEYSSALSRWIVSPRTSSGGGGGGGSSGAAGGLDFGNQPANINLGKMWSQGVIYRDAYYSAWVKAIYPNTAAYYISDGAGGAHNALNGVVTGSTTYRPTGNVWDGTQTQSYTGIDDIPLGDWAHIEWLQSGATMYCLIDGVATYYGATDGSNVWHSTYSGNRSYPPGGSDGIFYLGGSFHQNFPGIVKNVRGVEGSNAGVTVENRFIPRDYSGYITGADGGTQTRASVAVGLEAQGMRSFTDLGAGFENRIHHGAFSRFDENTPFPVWTAGEPTASTYVPTPPATPVGALEFDSFSRLNQLYLFDHIPNLGSTEAGSLGAKVWTPSGVGILYGRAVSYPSQGGQARILMDRTNMDIRVTRDAQPWVSTGILFRYKDDNNFYRITGGDTNIDIQAMVAGVQSFPAGFTVTGSWTVLRIVLSGTTMSVYTSPDGSSFTLAGTVTVLNDAAALWDGIYCGSQVCRTDNFTILP